MDGLKSLIKELNILASAAGRGGDVTLFQSKIYDEYLADLREAIRNEKAKRGGPLANQLT
jgi:hypothetical protein